jgi:hypothetical protein
MTLAIVWRSGRVSLVDISDINHIIDQGSVVLPGNPVCVKVVNTASGWTAYCGQNNGYLSVINISTTSMVKVIDIKLPNVDGDVSLDLSIDNNLIYAISNQDCTDSTMFVLDAQNLSAQPYLRNIPNFCMKVLYQLGSINLLYTVKSLTPSPSNPNTVEIATWT